MTSLTPRHPFPGSYGFTVFIAPPVSLTRALTAFISRPGGLVLYLCGNYPVFLPSLSRYSGTFAVRRALTAHQVITILDEAHQTTILFEHDRSLYEEGNPLIPAIARRCADTRADGRRIILFATRPDQAVHTFFEYADRVIYLYDMAAASLRVPSGKRSGKQETLKGIWE